ncbi:hypothetical protein KVT40_006336 [Elsinoe batatas]|uniref:AMP-dependent synthetase/ligase domain-containing protein n=1 Tax=Elsinoe batatas TaxID=2601811 RepID=A0A8K0PBM1_9PEZI|nr:hypothetical protein KVT40_006336 [Elsinoe batatas]
MNSKRGAEEANNNGANVSVMMFVPVTTDLAQEQYGRRLLNALIDHRARESPDWEYLLDPKTDDVADGFRHFRYGELASAISIMAYWLDETLGSLPQSADARETIAYIGPNDLRYIFLLLAAERTNRQLLVPLMQNSAEAQGRLLDSTDTQAVLSTDSHKHHWDWVLSTRGHIKSFVLPGLDHFYEQSTRRYPYCKNYEDVKNEACYIIQTSGTTGRFDENVYKVATLPLEQRPASSFGLEPHTRINTMPYSWTVGIIISLIIPLFSNTVSIVLPASTPFPVPTETVETVLRLNPSVDVGLHIPETIRRLLLTEAGTAHLKGLDQLIFVGAPLDQQVGDMLAQYTRVTNLIGSTETGGSYPCLVQPDPKDWAWLRLDLDNNGWSLENFTDDLYELAVKKDPARLLPGFLLHPDRDILRTGDLFQEHPDPAKKGYWRVAGRVDDFVKLRSMTKFNAIQIEMMLNEDREIERSVVGGADRPVPFVILQPAKQWESKEAAIEGMWKGVEKANAKIDGEVRLRREMVIVADSERKIEVTQNETRERRKAIEMYARKIEDLYTRLQVGAAMPL